MQPGDWAGLTELGGGDLETRLLANLDALLAASRHSDAAEDTRLADLPEALQTLWYLNWLDFEVCQGSLLAYFFNRHGRHAGHAEVALRRLGAHRAADVLHQAATIAAGEPHAWDQRHTELDALPEYSVVTPYTGLPGAEELEGLTSALHEALAADDWGDHLEAFLLDKAAELERWGTDPSPAPPGST